MLLYQLLSWSNAIGAPGHLAYCQQVQTCAYVHAQAEINTRATEGNPGVAILMFTYGAGAKFMEMAFLGCMTDT